MIRKKYSTSPIMFSSPLLFGQVQFAYCMLPHACMGGGGTFKWVGVFGAKNGFLAQIGAKELQF